MASNKDVAAQAMVIAEKKLMEKDIHGAKTHASMALNFYPELDGLSHLIKVIDVHIAYAKTVCGEVDWYGVLSVDPSVDDDFIRKQFLKLARILHPDKNKASYAEGALKMLTEGWHILSDQARRKTYDQRLGLLKATMRIPPPIQTGMDGVNVYAGDPYSTRYANSSSHQSFWTTCRLCNTYFEYKITYLDQVLHCIKCREPFFAVSQPSSLENGRKSFESFSFREDLPAHYSYACSVPSNVRGNCLPTEGTNGLSGDRSTGAKKLHPGLTKNLSLPASSSWPPSSASFSDEKPHPGGTSCPSGSSNVGDPSDFRSNSLLAPKSGTSNFSRADMNFHSSSFSCLGGARSTSRPVTSFHSASDGNQHFSRTFSPLPNSKTGKTSSPSAASTEHVKSPPHATCRPGGAGSVFSYYPTAYNIPSHSERIISSAPMRTATSYRLPQVLGDVKHDITKTENKESCISRGELTKKRQADECNLLSKAPRAGMANKKASGSRNFRQGNQVTDVNNNLDAKQILVHGSSKSKNTGTLSKPQLRSALLQKAKSDLHKKLHEWNMTSPSLPMPKIDVKKHDSTDTAEGSDATSPKNARKVGKVIQNVQGSHQAQTSPVATACGNMDTNAKDYVTMDVPDPDFHNFDQQRIEELFSEGQVWALYDDDDGMPRFYALIICIKSVRPFKIQINRLNSKTNTEFGSIEWITSGFTKTVGDFRIGKHVVSNALSAFSHIVKSKRLPKGVIQIYPAKGETWALYRNWSSSWNELTPEEEIHQYDIVLVLDDYNEQQGVLVAPLVKVAGFRSVFRQHDSIRVQTIQKEESFRFSHQVPSHTLTGEEAHNAPKGCMELDPAAMPLELLKVIQEDVVEEDGNSDSTGKSEGENSRNRLNRLVFTYSRRKKNRHTRPADKEEEGQRP